MLEFLGRFHPVFVHLPIGILLIACLFILLSLKPKFESIKSSINLLLFFGMLSAICSCITGYFLANGGDYDTKLVSNHQWMGIVTAIVSLALLLIHKYTKSNRIAGLTAVVLIILISITGHLGGSLTHGSDYLTAPIKTGNGKNTAAIQPIPNIQEAFIYQDAIQPLLKNRCYSCHGSEKQKGKLRLDLEAYILKGGEGGAAIVKGNADESDLIKRLLLPTSDDDHMPPKEKPQLSQNEIALLHWWINNGAEFNKKVKDIKQPENIKKVLAALQKGEGPGTETAEQNKVAAIPTKEVEAANDKTLIRLKNAGVMIVPVAQNSNYLTANFINATSTADSVMKMMNDVKEQLIWLKLSHNSVNDATLNSFRKFKNLINLNLNNTKITDKGLASLQDMNELQSLSLVGTQVTAKGLAQLSKLKKLRYLYFYKTGVQKTDYAMLKKLFPKVNLDSGNYVVPTLPQDTTLVKQVEEKKN